MPTQRVTLLKIIGDSGRAIAEQCRRWANQQARANNSAVPISVDRFANTLQHRRAELPVVYYTEWLDRWLMGNSFAEPFATHGGVIHASGRYDMLCFSERLNDMQETSVAGLQHDEQIWLATRLREASSAWKPLVDGGVLILLREVIGPATEDDEVTSASRILPDWLTGESGFPAG